MISKALSMTRCSIQSPGGRRFVLDVGKQRQALRKIEGNITGETKREKRDVSGTGEDSARAPSRLPQAARQPRPQPGLWRRLESEPFTEIVLPVGGSFLLILLQNSTGIMNCQRPANVNGERCGINPGKNNESRRYG